MRQRSITYWTPFSTVSFPSTTHLTRRLYARQGFIFGKQVPMDSAVKSVSRIRPKGHCPSQMTALSRTLETQTPFTIAASLKGCFPTYLVIVEHL
jgi:hypothetical protein